MLAFFILAVLPVAAAIHVIVAATRRPRRSRASPLLLIVAYLLAGFAVISVFAGRRSPDAAMSLPAAVLQQRTGICREAGVTDDACTTDSVLLSRAMLAVIDKRRHAGGAADAPAAADVQKFAAQAALRRQLSYAGYRADVEDTTMRLYDGRLPVACGTAFARIDAPQAGTVFGRNTRFVVFGDEFLWVEMLAPPADFEPVWRAFCT